MGDDHVVALERRFSVKDFVSHFVGLSGLKAVALRDLAHACVAKQTRLVEDDDVVYQLLYVVDRPWGDLLILPRRKDSAYNTQSYGSWNVCA